MVTAFFVYGTLQQGEVRAPRWPYKPLRIEPAETTGALYDLGPYLGRGRADAVGLMILHYVLLPQ